VATIRFHVTESLIHDIVMRVQNGAFPHVAAEAAGVPAEVFHDWLERGSRPGARDPYRGLAERVRHAHGHARCMAEIALHEANPRTWLLSGPGKSSADLPGWSTPVKGQAGADRRRANLLLEPQMQALIASLLDALTPFPDARAALAAKLDKKPAEKSPGTDGAPV
jgi:hypothetical protein